MENMSFVQECVEVPCGPSQGIDDRPALVRDTSSSLTFGFEVPPGLTLADLVKAAVLQTLARLHGNRTQAAYCLGISVRTLQRKLKQWHGEDHVSCDEADQFEAAMR
jgi:DNA-binding NtrC family response regulator